MLFFLCCSCVQRTIPFTPDDKGLLRNEWLSFDVKTYLCEKGELTHTRYSSRVIVHNGLERGREIVFINDDRHRLLLTDERAILIDDDYQEIGIYDSASQFYGELAMDGLQGALEYFPMYFHSNTYSVVDYDSVSEGYEVADGDTLYSVPAIKVERHCYTSGNCELIDVPITLFYSTKMGGFVKARQDCSQWLSRREYVSEITNISFADCSRLVDSVFDLDAEVYRGYDVTTGDQFFSSRTATDNTEATDEVLNYPLVNLATGETTTLSKMEGTTLLCFMGFYPDEDSHRKVEAAAKGVDNVLWVMPSSRNVKRLNEIKLRNHLGDNIFYTKGFNQVLSNLNIFYFFDCHHRVVSFSEWDNVENWVKTTIDSLKK